MLNNPTVIAALIKTACQEVIPNSSSSTHIQYGIQIGKESGHIIYFNPDLSVYSRQLRLNLNLVSLSLVIN